MMKNIFNETSFKQQQKKNQEHITPVELRRFVASKCPVEEIDGEDFPPVLNFKKDIIELLKNI